MLKYGILKERISALLTDGIRAVKNEKAHFPKGLPAMNDALNSHLTLEKLLYPDGLHSEKGV